MKIALVHPHSVPFATGGAENLVRGLQDHLCARGHDCEVVSLLGREGTLLEVVEGYDAFSALDLDGYDLVVSGKYPAWAVRHPRHVVWMLHCLRGLYDSYAAGPLPDTSVDAIAAHAFRFVREASRLGTLASADGRAHLLALLRSLAHERADLLAFPGPLAREIVHALDAATLDPRRIVRHAAISRTVAARASYFPREVEPKVLYPPPHRDDYRCGGDEYLFTSSRLDAPKRIDRLVAAMRHVRADVPLLIAGTGPQESQLREAADGDPRIRFLGHVPDAAMPGLYADALAVLFVPRDEDYGLVTIEAMKSGKPVLTASDSGGPREFVRHGVTGLVTGPEPEAIARGIEALIADRTEARAMGARARHAVAGITWEAVAHGLIEEDEPRRRRPRAPRRRRIVVATTFPVFPPLGGGQSRVFNLYRCIARVHDVEIVSLSHEASDGPLLELAPGLVERRVARSAEHQAFDREIADALGGVPAWDVSVDRLERTTPEHGAALAEACARCDVVVACHPFLAPALRRAAPSRPLWFEAQDVELLLKRDSYPAGAEAEAWLKEVRRLEARAWREAHVTFTCSPEDLQALERLYGASLARRLVVPNGVDVEAVRYLTPAEREERRRELGAGERPLALFVGSWHPPNIDAVEAIVAAARAVPEIDFVVAGSACGPFDVGDMPDNVRLLGLVSDAKRDALYEIADVALNPMRFGSGSNLKMFDYMASGLPILSSGFGARGIAAEPGRHYVRVEDGDWPRALREQVLADRAGLAPMARAARVLVEERYSWAGIADRFLEDIADLL